MSLSARIALEPSLRVAQAGLFCPLAGVIVATMTLIERWPMQRAALLVVAAIACAPMVGLGLRRLRGVRRTFHLALADRPEFDVQSSPRSVLDGSARLVESTVVWPGLWMLALRPTHGARIVRLAIRPCELRAGTRRPLGRFLIWSIRASGARLGEREKEVR